MYFANPSSVYTKRYLLICQFELQIDQKSSFDLLYDLVSLDKSLLLFRIVLLDGENNASFL